MDESKKDRAGDRRRLFRILGYLFRYRLIFFAGMVVSLLFGATETLVPWVMYLLLDQGGGARWFPADKLPLLLPLLLIGLFLLRGVLGFIRVYWVNWLQHTMVRDLREEMSAKLVRLPKAYHDRETSGILLSRLMQFADDTFKNSLALIVGLLQDVARVAGYLATMMLIEWRFTLVALVALPATLVVINLILVRVRRFAGMQMTKTSELTGSYSDTIQGHTVMKSFGGQEREYAKLSSALGQLRGIGLRHGAALALNMPLSQLLMAAALSVILGMLAGALGDGTLSEGEIGTFIFAMVLLPLPLRNISRILEQMQTSLAASKQVFDLLDSEPEDSGGSHAPEKVDGSIVFDKVSFAYPTKPDEQVLTEVSFEVKQGERIALVGPSGAGKSTITSLLLGFYRPDVGRISLDGVELRSWSLDALRAAIGVVSQDVILFNTSIAENIAYPHTGAAIDEKRLDNAIELAQARGIVDAQPDGLATVLGERGMLLSGGERQRLSIARAFYKDAPLLILDEATSALDAANEKSIKAALEKLLEGRTALIIAHHSAGIELADRIIVMEQGEVRASGNHAELMAADSLYRRLYEMQAPSSADDR